MLKVGDTAPDFTAQDCKGNTIRLSDHRGRRVILFFFPRAFTMGCTIENRAFRDNHDRIRHLGADLIGVSMDSVERQCRFAEEENIHFALVGDENAEISRAYGVKWPGLNLDRRATFIISPDGVIEEVIHHEIRVYRHLDDVLKFLKESGGTSASPSAANPEHSVP